MSYAFASNLDKIDITSSNFKADPYPLYRYLRQKKPVWRTHLPGHREVWIVSRYDDANTLLHDERFVKDVANILRGPDEKLFKAPWMPGFLKPVARNMLDLDAPDHGRLKALVHKAFTPKLIEALRAYITEMTLQLIQKMQRHGTGDLVRDFATPLPVAVIAQVIGVPETDREHFYKWSKAVVNATTSPADIVRVIPNIYRFMRYLRKLIALRRTKPQEDLLTALVQAEEAGDALSEDELVAMLFILLVAGHETTVNLLASGTLALLQNPDQLALVRGNPSIMRTAVEELLRFVTPVDLSTERYASQDVVIDGVTIPRGALTFAALGSANRDESQFAEPDVLNLTRDPNRHLAFGQGAHYCLGAPLARLEAQIAMPMLLERFPNLRLARPAEQLRWRKSLVMRGLDVLPLRW